MHRYITQMSGLKEYKLGEAIKVKSEVVVKTKQKIVKAQQKTIKAEQKAIKPH